MFLIACVSVLSQKEGTNHSSIKQSVSAEILTVVRHIVLFSASLVNIKITKKYARYVCCCFFF